MGADQTAGSGAKVPPRWFILTAWQVHRALYRVSGGRLGLRRPKPGAFGMMRMHTTGRRSGRDRAVIVAYFEDGPNVVTLAMNGWGDPPPAWWLNLQANPDATVILPGDDRRRVRAREATGSEHARLWDTFRTQFGEGSDLDALARLRSRPTPVVVLEPAP
ncbi:nitroreductase/quinone reductase family protein [Myceligenerans crystallogenes]|uniref:Nitroreductase/quinone reductase family protein n=1 Tax=Myceligenerans crystallogenes TaxID=316335 RepID=A0ABP4ZQT7_9MICO